MPRLTRNSRRRQEPPRPQAVGQRVKKEFQVKNQVWKPFVGQVTSLRWDEEYEKHLYHIRYEDDDEESLFWEELEDLLVTDDTDSEEEGPDNHVHGASSSMGGRGTTTPTKSARKKSAVVTPAANDQDFDPHVTAVDNDHDGDLSLDASLDEDDVEVVQVETPKKKKRKPRKPSSPKTAQPPVLSSSKDIAKWGLPRGALARCPRTNFTVRALDSIPPNPAKPSALLPGRFLLVATDDDGVVDKQLVGQTFASSAELHRQIAQRTTSQSKIRFATYELQAVSDPAFSSWEFAMARLESISLQADNPSASVVYVSWDGRSAPAATVSSWNSASHDATTWSSDRSVQWALLEAQESSAAPILLGVPIALLQWSSEDDDLPTVPSTVSDADDNDRKVDDASSLEPIEDLQSVDTHQEYTHTFNDILPRPSNATRAAIQLAASLLQKSIRRGRKLSSPVPLLEACRDLIHPLRAKPGSTFAFLKTLWTCMIVDVAPFDDGKDCLGLPGLLVLSILAKADPRWTMPLSLGRAAVASALRTFHCDDTKQWVGFVRRNDSWHKMEATLPSSEQKRAARALNLRNLLRATQTVAGGTLAWGRWNSFVGDPSAAAALTYADPTFDGSLLPGALQPVPKESLLLDSWDRGFIADVASDPNKWHLDQECRLAAIEPSILPHSLVLLQAILARPPTSWKKHSLPNLSRQIRKLIAEVNPRYRERVQLARLATWGKEKSDAMIKSGSKKAPATPPMYNTYREVVTITGTLSAGETELAECFEAIQKWQLDGPDKAIENPKARPCNAVSVCRVTAGAPLSASDGRIAFLLAFSEAIEVEANGEIVSAMFCGDADNPLLVQRIGKARLEGKEMATAGGATSGATAVPSLGYVQRDRSNEEAELMDAAEEAVALHWKGGKYAQLPLPPAGFQWKVGLNASGNQLWDMQEQSIHRTAELYRDKKGKARWKFSVEGVSVDPFNARPIISPCRLDIMDLSHNPVPLPPQMEANLRIVLYAQEPDVVGEFGAVVLAAMSALQLSAHNDRTERPNEGTVYDWLPIAQMSAIPARTWRDALLAIRTRLHRHVLLGHGIRSDGSGTPRDMTEGVLIRIFHALECLYPMALRKEGAFRFRVRPLGASYHHLLSVLEQLGRGTLPRILTPVFSASNSSKLKRKLQTVPSNQDAVKAEADAGAPRSKRPRRRAAFAAARKIEMFDGLSEKDSCNKTVINGDVRRSGAANQDEWSDDCVSLPAVTTKLWEHQQASCDAVVHGVTQNGKRGHADASAVGAGKTLTALATVVRLGHWLHKSGKPRHGSLVMLPTKALIREWLREIATHTKGFHIVEQREDGALFSLTYNKKNCPIDANTIVISTLDRVCNHPFVRQSAWDFVVIDECLSVQNANAKRTPSAWRQIEISTCGVLMLSATFFRSKYDDLFYMIRMLRSPLPRSKEWLPATIHEHIVCQIPETDRSWQMKAEMVPLAAADLASYRSRIDSFRRRQLNDPERANGLELFKELREFLRVKFEGRTGTKSTTYAATSAMAEAFVKLSKKLLCKRRRPLIFADTGHEAEFLIRVLQSSGLDARTWTNIATKQVSGSIELSKNMVIVAVKTTEGQGINMQHYADTIICRPTAGDHLEQMKGRIDRPGQSTKDLHLYVVVCEHSIEETAFANINLAGNFFREYIAPVAERYKERIDLSATLSVGGKKKLTKGTVLKAWRSELEMAGQSGSFANAKPASHTLNQSESDEEVDDVDAMDAPPTPSSQKSKKAEPRFKSRNTVLVNKGNLVAVKEAKERARNGEASWVIREWLFARPGSAGNATNGPKSKISLPHKSMLRYSDQKPPLVMNATTVQKAVTYLSQKDPKLAALIARVGADSLISDIGEPKKLTQARLFDQCLRAITFTMVSVDAGNVFLRKLAIKIGALLETFTERRRQDLLSRFSRDMVESDKHRNDYSPEALMDLFVKGDHKELLFTPDLVGELVRTCYMDKGKRVGHPHLSGDTVPCGKNDDPRVFLEKARRHARGGKSPVSAGYSIPKASYIISLVDDFQKNKISGEMVAKASDREAFGLLTQLKGIADWSAGQILMHHFCRADIMLYGDLTVRNYLNDLYDIHHAEESETLLESAAEFKDNAHNRNLIDDLAERNGWKPYRSVVCYLCYHLQEENLVLL